MRCRDPVERAAIEASIDVAEDHHLKLLEHQAAGLSRALWGGG